MIPERYTFNGIIGKGEFATVHKGFDLIERETIAIKEIDAAYCIETSFNVQCFEDLPEYKYFERKMPSHPNLLRYRDVFWDEDEIEGVRWYIVTDFLEGSDLMEILTSRRDKLNIKEYFDLLCPLVEGLKYLQDHGICHRDVKPENIMVTPENRVVLIDMGLCCFKNDPSTYQSSAGTADYASPQILSTQENEWDVWQANDVWSLGVTMYTALHLDMPFVSISGRKDLFEQIKTYKPVINFDDHNEHIPGFSIRYTLSRSLNKEYTERITLNGLLAVLGDISLLHPLDPFKSWNEWLEDKSITTNPTTRTELLIDLDRLQQFREKPWYRRLYRKIFRT